MGFCVCNGTIYRPPGGGPKVCDGCLIANGIIIGCGQGLGPCGDSTIIKLNDYNKNPSGAQYFLRTSNAFDPQVFSSVLLKPSGELEILTGLEMYEPHKLYRIEYVVRDGKYSNFGWVEFCFDNPCGQDCRNMCGTCNPCTGQCYGQSAVTHVDADCGSTGNTADVGSSLNLSACDGVTTFGVKPEKGIAASIDPTGLITFDVDNTVIADGLYKIHWDAVCSKYGLHCNGVVTVKINNKCVGVICNAGEMCDPCTGSCVPMSSDLEAKEKAAGGFVGSGGTIIR